MFLIVVCNCFTEIRKFFYVLIRLQSPIMKWHNLMILLATLALVAATFAEEIEIPEDIDEDELGG
jgi:hypothetical protein